MKDFVKYTLATLCGLFLTGVALLVIGILFILGMTAAGSQPPSLKSHSVLRLTLDGTLQEDAPEDPFQELLGTGYPVMSLKHILAAIHEAKKNPKIEGIYIEAQTISGATPAMIREIREALTDFKQSGKFILAYGDHYSQGCYYICSVADKIILNPQGQISWQGMASQPVFYKDMLEKIGVKMQVFKVGHYKSAVEPFTSTQMSDSNREQITSYLNDIWDVMLKDVSSSRDIPLQQLDAYADSMLALRPAQELLRKGMIDTLCYIDGVDKILRTQTGEKKGQLPFVTVKDMVATATVSVPANDKIVVYYAYGDIVDRKTEWSENVIETGTVCSDLKKLREDQSVKAVVLRVNSGGGSAYASEQIWNELRLLRDTKPVVVSMGGMAASGAYYISSIAHYIIADPTTLTGSIGIFGLIPDASSLLNDKLGLHFDVIKTNRYADFGTIARPFNPSEAHLLQEYIQHGYQLFIQRVAEGRGMPLQDVERLAEGRVWTGHQATENGLVDSNGNLASAIQKAADLAHLQKYQTEFAPQPASWYETLLDHQRKDYFNATLQETLGDYYIPWLGIKHILSMNPLQARMPYEPNFIN